MKKYILLFSTLFFVVFISSAQQEELEDHCTYKESKEKCKDQLAPYKYDAAKRTKVTLKNRSQMKELEVPLYFGEDYRFIFNTEGMPQEAHITIYNKKAGKRNRKILYTSKKEDAGKNLHIWEPEKSMGKVYVNYEIPETFDVVKKGCIVMVLGYKI